MVKVSPATNGFVYYLDQRLIGPDGRANPEFIASPTEPGQQGQYVYLYGPKMVTLDIGLNKSFRIGGVRVFNFEALFINAFNHRNTVVGGTNGATISIDSTLYLRPDHRHVDRLTRDSVPAGSELVAVMTGVMTPNLKLQTPKRTHGRTSSGCLCEFGAWRLVE